jgi:hypothetical protein
MVGAYELMTRGEYAKMYEAAGGKVASFYSEGHRRELRGEAHTALQKTYQAVQETIGALTRLVSAPESFIRIAEFRDIHRKAKKEGKSDLEAGFEALEASREVTVNFARAGVVARAWNQLVPYTSASFAGQRKMFRALGGLEGRTDAERARIQRAAWANGIMNITIPSMILWSLSYDDEDIKDLPEWRKRWFHNVKVNGQIWTLPKAFELGLLFGTIPEMIGDYITDSNPIALGPTLGDMMFPYMRGVSAVVPTFARGPAELFTNKDFFTEAELSP